MADPSAKPDEPKPETTTTETVSEPKSSKYALIRDVGVSADKNAKHRRFMEDAHTVEPNLSGDEVHAFFGVYDGHGGKSAAEFCRAKLHEVLKAGLASLKPDASHEEVCDALREAHLKTDKEMKETVPSAGACTVCALIRKQGDIKTLYVANLGDARAVLLRNGTASRLSVDHKPGNEDETKRIEAAGGFITNGRVNGMVAVARAMGDHCMKDYISGEPAIKHVVLEPNDTHLILACDGVWDVLSDQEAFDHIKEETEAQAASKKLLIAALKGGSTDNISVMSIFL